jgi:hypothetical protein
VTCPIFGQWSETPDMTSWRGDQGGSDIVTWDGCGLASGCRCGEVVDARSRRPVTVIGLVAMSRTRGPGVTWGARRPGHRPAGRPPERRTVTCALFQS